MKQRTLILGLVGAGLVLAVTSAALDLDPSTWFSHPAESTTTPASQAEPAPNPAATVLAVPALPSGTSPNYRAIALQAGPAVVGINVVGVHKSGAEEFALDPNDPFFQFFRGLPGFQWRSPGRSPESTTPFRSQGSGFIISSDGVLLTNAHVVREAKEVVVKLSDRREFTAKVLGSDPSTDIAVLRINAKQLPVVRLGDADALQVGDPVLAIGSPFGFEQTATHGIVSAKGRSLPGDTAVPFIQTDAAVNPGNSGGPLFDGSGAVVGINAQIYSQSGGYQGLSFAIPINVALKVKDQIISTGRASHARLGVVVQDLKQALAESFGVGRPDGALIAQVTPDSAAAAAGLRAGDVITAFNGEPVVRAADLSRRISQAVPDETVRLTVWRDHAARQITVKLGRAQTSAEVPVESGPDAQPHQWGLRLRPLTRDEQEQIKVQGGLLVEGATGAAARSGIVAGDVLLAINGVPLKAIDQLRQVLEKKPRRVALLVLRNGERIFVPVELD